MPSRRPRRKTRAAAWLVVGALALAACADPEPPGVAVRALSADIVFGVPDAPRAAPPANFGPSLDPLDLADFGPEDPGPFLPPIPKPVPCPKAGINTFPAEGAALNVPADRRPQEGDWRWVRGGTLRNVTSGATADLAGFERRLVRDVRTVSDDEFGFETVQRDLLSGETVVTRWKVRTRTAAVGDTARVGDENVTLPRPPGAPQRPTAGEPERGVVIERITRVARDGTESVFAPASGLLVLPLPVQAGEQWRSTAVDPRSFQSITYDATVVGPERVDACGKLVEGWLVKGTQTFGGAGTVSRSYELVLATQFGAVPLAERVEQTGDGAELKVAFRVAQTQPDPLPADSSGGPDGGGS